MLAAQIINEDTKYANDQATSLKITSLGGSQKIFQISIIQITI